MTRRWICPQCKTLLGIQDEDLVEIRYKAATYVVKAADSIMAICRRCGKRVTTAQ